MIKQYCSVIILAGGKSSRMAYPKPYLKADGMTFIEKISGAYIDAGFHNVVAVLYSKFCKGEWVSNYEKCKAKFIVVENSNPELGRFYSLQLGLKEIGDSEFCFIQNVDNPFVGNDVIDKLWENRDTKGYTSPVFKGERGHPILISRYIMDQISNTENTDISLKNYLANYSKNEVEVDDDLILRNINTREEYFKVVTENQLCERSI
jgi:molybdenum cofactor cytidylyltransferase